MVEFDVEGMTIAIAALQQTMVRLQADVERLTAATPEAQFKMFKALEYESDKRDAEFTND